ncbi:YHYH domain [Phytophthora cinnamomi]|uniref:YHYH domain n=1 Tax=Phytophthora cinnamomi TaxID=4785 RepID=UPI003559D92E|nr:YHYH domain [Phytophthora cinnamomi]
MSVRASLVLPRLAIASGNSVIKIDAYSVPATVKLASPHEDGVYGAGEVIEIQVTFSKQVVLLSGLNRNQDWHARYPVALEFQNNIYMMWTERDDMHTPTKSYLYLRVFSSTKLDVVATTSVSAINRLPNTIIEKVALTVWKDNLYAAWDEGGLLYCAVYEGLTSTLPWTLIPNMGANKNLAMTASDPVLLVYNLELVMIWREISLPAGSSTLVGQIRVAVRNDDNDAPLWIFHDGNQLDTGLNKNPLRDADDPVSVVYRARISAEPFATYTGGSGTNVLRFAYTAREGDMALPLEYAGIDALSMASPNLQLTAAANELRQYRFVSLRLPVPGATGSLSNNRDIHIDTLEPPRVLSVGTPMADGIYTAGDTITVSVTFSAPVTVAGLTPTLLLVTGNPTTDDSGKKAIYVSGSGTTVLLFEYQVQTGDQIDRLEYQPCPLAERSFSMLKKWDKLVICSSSANSLQLGGVGSSIKRTSTIPMTDAVLDLPEVNDWAEVRFDTTSDDFIYVTQVEPITGIAKADLTLIPPLVNEFSVSQQRSAINIYSNGIPDHTTKLRDSVKEQKYFIELQRFPTLQSQPLNLSYVPDGFSGVFLNGILFKNNNRSAQATDDCGGAIDAAGYYFYVDLPTCYLTEVHEPRQVTPGFVSRPPSVIVGYAFDGFPIYGYYDENGGLPSDLDECNGRIRQNGQYAYHLLPPETSSLPFMPCLRGIDTTSASLAQLAVFRYPTDISAVEGLPLADLTKFDSFVIDENPTPLHAEVWLNPEGMTVVYTSTTVIVRSTGVPPADSSFGPFPNAYNRYSVFEQDYVFQFPRNPVVSATTTSLPLDIPIGVMVNGVPFYSATSTVYGGSVLDSNNPAYVLLDKCNGLVDAGGDYRYYASPDCLLQELGDTAGQPSPLVGFAFDGFPLYGPYAENGQAPSDLDACNGRIGDDGTYRYHVTLGPPFLLGCFRGTPSTDQISRDAATDLYRSLSYAHALRLNTDHPYVAHVYTNKRPGKYVAGESVDVVVEWSTPVKVDATGGVPSLSIQNSTRPATYDSSRSTETQSVFLFIVQGDDVMLEEFSYNSDVGIKLNGGRITRLAKLPVLDADLGLVPADLDDVEVIRTRTVGLISKFQLVRDLSVELRGLYHPRAQDLRARIFHGYRESTIFDGCCATRDAFGVPDVPDVLTNRAQLASEPRNPTSGVGWDYSFRDSDGVKNLAQDGGATALQSSISGTCGPMNAIDGKIRNVAVSTQTVARTLPANEVNESAWWELRLVDLSTIGTIRIWLAGDDDLNEQESMLPLWVMLFDGPAVMDVESFADAYDRAIFLFRVDSRQANRSVISVVPPLGTKAQYVRLVAERPRGVMSLAEVEVFAEQNYVLSQYAGGTPVRTVYYPGGETWSPEEPFRYAFGAMPSEGTWILAIEDMAVNGSTQAPRSNATAGGISDWVIDITNQAGETVSYYMDFQAQVHALPRHGTLYVSLDETERDHLDIDGNGILDSMEADVYLRRYSPNNYIDLPTNTRDRELKEFLLSYEEYGGVRVLRDPSERQLRLPSLVCDPACLAAIKMDPYFYVGQEGDKAMKFLRVVGDRVVKYVPDAGFRGLDAFTFSVAITGQESRVLGTIQLTVKECEDPDCRMSSFLLHRSTR